MVLAIVTRKYLETHWSGSVSFFLSLIQLCLAVSGRQSALPERVFKLNYLLAPSLLPSIRRAKFLLQFHKHAILLQLHGLLVRYNANFNHDLTAN